MLLSKMRRYTLCATQCVAVDFSAYVQNTFVTIYLSFCYYGLF